METANAPATRPLPPTPAQILASRDAQARAAGQPDESRRGNGQSDGNSKFDLQLGRTGEAAAGEAKPTQVDRLGALAVDGNGQSPPVRQVQPAQPVRRPGAPAIPPARIAMQAGDAGIDLGYDRGRSMMDEAPPMTAPILSRPLDTQDPTMVQGLTIRPAAEMDAGTANATLGRMVENLKQWTANFPHEVAGEPAHVLQMLRRLTSRQRMRTDAEAYGQPIALDEIETARHVPPPEAFALKAVCEHVEVVLEIYQRALDAAGLQLTSEDQATVDELRKGLRVTRGRSA